MPFNTVPVYNLKMIFVLDDALIVYKYLLHWEIIFLFLYLCFHLKLVIFNHSFNSKLHTGTQLCMTLNNAAGVNV